MTGQKVIKDFPKTTAKIVEYLKESLLKSESGSEVVKEQVKAINQQTVSFMIGMGTPRFLYDFFDYVEIHISVIPVDMGSIMWATVVGESINKEDLYFTREQAEQTVFLKAFKIYEDELVA